MLHSMRALAHGYPAEVVQRVIRFPDTAPGAQLDIAVPGESLLWPIALRLDYVSAGGVNVPQPYLTITDGTSELVAIQVSDNISANATTTICWTHVGYNSASFSSFPILTLPIPEMVMLPGWRYVSRVQQNNPGDTMRNITLTAIEMFTGRQGHRVDVERELVERMAGALFDQWRAAEAERRAAHA